MTDLVTRGGVEILLVHVIYLRARAREILDMITVGTQKKTFYVLSVAFFPVCPRQSSTIVLRLPVNNPSCPLSLVHFSQTPCRFLLVKEVGVESLDR